MGPAASVKLPISVASVMVPIAEDTILSMRTRLWEGKGWGLHDINVCGDMTSNILTPGVRIYSTREMAGESLRKSRRPCLWCYWRGGRSKDKRRELTYILQRRRCPSFTDAG